ncbi:MAG: sel1 repeat family protein [Proteobacteria bacterium]|nr:sel1 repeat family protein [Pseudomonadota bacterium]
MRISERHFTLGAVGVLLSLAPAAAFDGSTSPSRAIAPERAVAAVPRVELPSPTKTLGIAPVAPAPIIGSLTAVEAFRSGAAALRAGETAKAVLALQFAAEQGLPAAQWKLARMYAQGEGVEQNDLRAFEYFTRIANAHADDQPNTPQGRLVANAFVALGHYHLDGIANSSISPDAERARQMFAYAASYFGDPDAQYNLGRLYLEGTGTHRDQRQAARWLTLAAHKGHYKAQATLGAMLFKGGAVPRQAARGLMWLTLGREAAGPADAWIRELYDAAFKQATADERTMAVTYLDQHSRARR